MSRAPATTSGRCSGRRSAALGRPAGSRLSQQLDEDRVDRRRGSGPTSPGISLNSSASPRKPPADRRGRAARPVTPRPKHIGLRCGRSRRRADRRAQRRRRTAASASVGGSAGSGGAGTTRQAIALCGTVPPMARPPASSARAGGGPRRRARRHRSSPAGGSSPTPRASGSTPRWRWPTGSSPAGASARPREIDRRRRCRAHPRVRRRPHAPRVHQAVDRRVRRPPCSRPARPPSPPTRTSSPTCWGSPGSWR